jgi:capsular polysaccharide biosynthesis protein
VTVADVYSALWRYRFFIALMTAALVALTWVFTSQQTEQYTASTIVRVQQRVANQTEAFGALQTGERLARTYAVIAATKATAEQVRSQLGIATRDKVDIEAAQVENLELLKISATDPDPVRAARIANAVPVVLNEFIDKGTLRDQIITVERATPPTSPSSPNLALNLALALVIGLILNAALALLMSVLSDRVGDVEQVEREFGYPVIVTIPSLKFSKPAVRPQARTAGERRLVQMAPSDTGGS